MCMLYAGMGMVTQAQVFNTVLNFDGTNGATPANMSLVQNIDGSLVGTTGTGGIGGGCGDGNGCNVLFRLTTSGVVTSISLCNQQSCAVGANPIGGLLLGTNLNFYGTSSDHGPYNGGTIFKVNSSGSLTTLYAFCGGGGLCSDGRYPVGALIQADDGNFYGTTSLGGYNYGTVFKITPSGSLTTIYRFCSTRGCSNGDGYYPFSGVIQGTDGNLYGTTEEGGSNTCSVNDSGGTIFKITPSGKKTTIYSFGAQPNCVDGFYPVGGLIQANDGSLYGTTTYGGANCHTNHGLGCGTVFKLSPTGVLTTLYNFCSLPNCADGFNPVTGLIQANDGNFYGTTGEGDDPNQCDVNSKCGTVFEITPSGVLTTLHAFSGSDGELLEDGLFQATSGIIYGATEGGGSTNFDGTVFSLSLGLPPFVSFVHGAGRVGQVTGVLGQGFNGTTNVFFNGVSAPFTVKSATYLTAIVPAGATTGYVTVTTPSGTLTSNVPFRVIP